MSKLKRVVVLVFVIATALVATQAGIGTSGPTPWRGGAVEQVVRMERGEAPPMLPNGLFVPLPSGGMQRTVRELLIPSVDAAVQPDPVISTYGCPHVFTASGMPDNIRSNQDCGFRFQSEEWVAVNPTDPNNIVASQNDSKYSGNRTGVQFSLDGGLHWGNSELPVGRVNIAEVAGGQWSFDAITDPAHTWDSQGNLYYSAIAFDAFQDGFSALVVWKSNYCLKGSALHTPGSGSCEPFSPPLAATAIVPNHNFLNPVLSDDKNLMAADPYPDSPFRDNVYVTWTIFDFSCGPNGIDYCESPIFFTRSEDGGVTWSDPLEISGDNPDVCDFGDLFDETESPSACNFSQGSYPLVGPDGTIYVVFNNANTSPEAANFDGIAQQLIVKSTDGGLTWTDPVKVADDYAKQPVSTFRRPIDSCPLLRQCLPANGYRMNDYPSMGIDENTGRLAVFWADFRNAGRCSVGYVFGNRVPQVPCRSYNNDVFVSISDDDGVTWGQPLNVTPNGAAQWQPWGDVGEDGNLYVGYYDRQYGDCESTGCNDITLASSSDGASWSYQRITTSSMPNLTCSNNPFQCGFLGDYMSIQHFGGTVYLVWGDTRGRELGGVPDEDNYFAKVDT
jgi:hypothetical protein